MFRKKQSKYWKQRTQWAEVTEKESRIWNGEELQARLGGISYTQAGERLEKMAESVGWVVFRDKTGRVHAIAKRKFR